jgi:hypothetical protein
MSLLSYQSKLLDMGGEQEPSIQKCRQMNISTRVTDKKETCSMVSLNKKSMWGNSFYETGSSSWVKK